jgi:hypothetical protein
MFGPVTTSVEYPLMQAPASFNLSSIEEKLKSANDRSHFCGRASSGYPHF